MNYVDWFAGMKVVCVDTDWTHPELAAYLVSRGAVLPVTGKIYTIREIGPHMDGTICVRVREILNPVIPYPGFKDGEPSFEARRFRPVQPRQTDISIFTQMLNPSKINVGEPA